MMAKRKVDGTVDQSSADQEIHKSGTIVHKSEGLHLAEPGLMVGRQSGRRNLGEM